MRFLVDEDFDHRIVRGLIRRAASLDILLSSDAGLRGAPDAEVLQRAADDGRILLTHDVSTMVEVACLRVGAGEKMYGRFAVPQSAAIGSVIESLLLLGECSEEAEWDGMVVYLPL